MPFSAQLVLKLPLTDTELNDVHSITKGRGGRPPLPFFENRKKCPDFGGEKKGSDSVYFGV